MTTQLTQVQDGKRVLKIGQKRTYSRASGRSGSGKIEEIRGTKKGPYIGVFDKDRGRVVFVRPSEIS